MRTFISFSHLRTEHIAQYTGTPRLNETKKNVTHPDGAVSAAENVRGISAVVPNSTAYNRMPRSDVRYWPISAQQIVGHCPPVPIIQNSLKEQDGDGVDRARQLANEQVQLAHIETCLAIVLPSQFEKGKSILVGGNATVGRSVQINEATLHYKHDQSRFW